MDYGLTVIALGLLILLAARLDRIETRKTEGAAIVNDGDTITLGTERIRMRGIDAPEYSQICRRDGADYPCGKLARQSLVRLISGKPVSCTGWQRDRYGRRSAIARPAARISIAPRSRPVGRSPMAISTSRKPPPGTARPASGPARSTSRMIGAKATISRRSKESTAPWLRSAMHCEKFFASGDDDPIVVATSEKIGRME
ncbi:hypothetical protein MESS4_590073 [Mesorhizobium sp. STM 4661]|nr:thermonuclease family protein [Mesorhizobium sp. STM 4661]CCV13710.1 hypothetical protein MESS4_590073 [Mesorhizobium sp. STM 4661]